jgi:hypothetical protein
MFIRQLLCFSILAVLCLSGCGEKNDKHGTGGGTGGGQHSKLMLEACDLSMKILAERESGKNVDEVNQKFASQVADIDTRIAKLPKLSDDESNKLISSAKPREVEAKFSDLAEKGKLHETGKILKLPNYALGDPEPTGK